MGFNYKYAVIKNQLEFLAEWLALEKQFIPLFKALRTAGGENLVDKIYKFIFTGDLQGLNNMISPSEIVKLKLQPEQIPEVTAAISSIIGIMQRIGSQQIFQQLLSTMQSKDKSAIIKNITMSVSDDLSALFSEQLIAEINSNPGLLPVLRSGRVGMGAQMGLPQARLTTDLLQADMGSTFANEMPFVSNFLNLLTTLMHRAVVSQQDLNSLMPDLGEEVKVSPPQDFAFVTMCQSGADPDSREAQYDVLNWIEATEKGWEDQAIELEEKFPSIKSLEMIKRLADEIGEQGFRANGTDQNAFYKIYDILSTARKPQEAKWATSDFKNRAQMAGLNTEQLKDQLYKQGLNFEQILLEYIPEIYRSLYLTARSVASLSPEEQEAYKQQYPQIAKILDDEKTDTDNGLKIRTAQLLLLKDGVTKAWGSHVSRFFKDVQGMFPGMTQDKFVELVFLDDDSTLRKEIGRAAQGLSIDITPIMQSESEHEILEFRNQLQLGHSKKEQYLFMLITKLMRLLSARNQLMYSADIGDLEMFKEVLAQKTQLLDFTNIFANIPGVAKLWNEPNVMAGRQVMNPAYTGQITRSDILQAGGFNPLAANKNFKNAVQRKNGETLEDFKDRLALLLRSLVDQGRLFRRFTEDEGEESPLSPSLKSRPNSANPAIKAINVLVNAIIKEEGAEQVNDDFEDEEEYDEGMYIPQKDPTAPSEAEMQTRLKRKEILEELFHRENLTIEDVGVLSLNPTSTQNKVDPEFADIGLSTDSEMSAKVLDIFRNHFNLPVCSYALEINSPKECTVNSNGFKLDFSILADKLITNPDGTLYLEPNILLAGEAFGYKRYTGRPLVVDEERLPAEGTDERIEQVKRNARVLKNYSDGITSADGDWKINLSDDGKQLMAEWPEIDKDGNASIRKGKADRFVEYTIRSSYKEPYETFLAHIIGADTLFIPPFDPKREEDVIQTTNTIAAQLDELSVVWASNRGGSKAYQSIKSYKGQLPEVFNKYLGDKTQKPYTNSELYARTLLAHYDLQNIVIPLYLANPEAFPIVRMAEYQKRYKELCEQLAMATDPVAKNTLIMQIRDLRKLYNLDSITEKYREYIQSQQPQDEYQAQTLGNRQAMYNLAAGAASMNPIDVHNSVFGQKPLFNRQSVVNSVDYHQFPASIYAQQRVASRWWGR